MTIDHYCHTSEAFFKVSEKEKRLPKNSFSLNPAAGASQVTVPWVWK
jgi:hypothetical protein